jgi:hypothetical protein
MLVPLIYEYVSEGWSTEVLEALRTPCFAREPQPGHLMVPLLSGSWLRHSL